MASSKCRKDSCIILHKEISIAYLLGLFHRRYVLSSLEAHKLANNSTPQFLRIAIILEDLSYLRRCASCAERRVQGEQPKSDGMMDDSVDCSILQQILACTLRLKFFCPENANIMSLHSIPHKQKPSHAKQT